MMISAKRFFLLLIFLFCSSFVLSAKEVFETSTGSSTENPSETRAGTAPYQGTISIGVFGDLNAALMRVINSQDFKQKFPGIQVELNPSDFGGHHYRLVTQISAGTGANDIEALDIEYLKRFAASGGLENLNQRPYFGSDASIQLAYYAVSNSTTESGEMLALPVTVSPAVMYYRKSLADAAGVNMEQIRTWDEFVEIGKRLTKDLNGDGIIDQFALPHALELSTLPIHGGQGNWFDGDYAYKPEEKYLEALTLVQKINNSGISAGYVPWSGEWINSFKRNEVAVVFSGNWLGTHLEYWMAPDLAGDWRIAPLPQDTYSSFGGNYLAIPQQTDSRKKLVCYKIIEYLCTNPEVQASIMNTIDAFPALISLYNQPMMDKQFPYFGNQKIRKIFAETVLNIPVQFLSDKDLQAYEYFNKAIDAVLRENTEPADALKTASSQVMR